MLASCFAAELPASMARRTGRRRGRESALRFRPLVYFRARECACLRGELESRNLLVEVLQTALESLAVPIVFGNLNFAQDARALQHQAVALAKDLRLFRAEGNPPGVGSAFF